MNVMYKISPYILYRKTLTLLRERDREGEREKKSWLLTITAIEC
jgi:hypothetical protein